MTPARAVATVLLGGVGAAAAGSQARVLDLERHSPFDHAEVLLQRVDGDRVERGSPEHMVAAGMRRLEILCIAHLPGGMAEYTVRSNRELSVDLASDRSYRLTAVIDERGACQTELVPADASASDGQPR